MKRWWSSVVGMVVTAAWATGTYAGDFLGRDPDGMSASEWQAFAASLAQYQGDWPDVVSYAADELLPQRVRGAFVLGDDAPQALAEVLAGEVGGGGVVTGHRGPIAIDAPADTCWLVLGHFEAQSGDEGVSWSPSASDFRALQPFSLALRPIKAAWGTDVAIGFCASAAVTWRADVALSFAGSSTRWRWAAVRWARLAMPVFVAARARPAVSEACNAEALLATVLHPVPGTLAFDNEGRPGLVQTYVSGSILLHALFDADPRYLRPHGQANAVPEARLIPSRWPMAVVCGDRLDEADLERPSQDARVRKFLACEDSIGKRFDTTIETAEARRDRAGSDASFDALQVAVDRLYQAMERAEAQQCGPLLAPIQRDMDAAMVKLADYLATRPTLPGPDLVRYHFMKSSAMATIHFPH